MVFPDFLGEPYLHNREAKELLENLIKDKIGRQVEVKMILKEDLKDKGVQLQAVSVEEKIRQQLPGVELTIDDEKPEIVRS